jgi:fatty acid desaturase
MIRAAPSAAARARPPAAHTPTGRFATPCDGNSNAVTAIVILLVVVGALVGLGFAFGGPALAVLLVLAGLVVVGWLIFLGFSRRTPGDVARQADEGEFFGPGGPDDPNR